MFYVIRFAALITLIFLLAGCSRSGKPILIVLPDGFTEEFWIVKDLHSGLELREENGFWVFEIPAEGVLYIKDDRPFYVWHHEVARYKSGQSVKYEDLGTLAGRRRTGHNSSESSTEFDGTTHHYRVSQDR